MIATIAAIAEKKKGSAIAAIVAIICKQGFKRLVRKLDETLRVVFDFFTRKGLQGWTELFYSPQISCNVVAARRVRDMLVALAYLSRLFQFMLDKRSVKDSTVYSDIFFTPGIVRF